jgi:hypothetical protein
MKQNWEKPEAKKPKEKAFLFPLFGAQITGAGSTTPPGRPLIRSRLAVQQFISAKRSVPGLTAALHLTTAGRMYLSTRRCSSNVLYIQYIQ